MCHPVNHCKQSRPWPWWLRLMLANDLAVGFQIRRSALLQGLSQPEPQIYVCEDVW